MDKVNSDIYRALAGHLDDLPGGFPSTKSGVELRILKKLFSPEEARLACCLTLIPEGPHVIAGRFRQSTGETAKKLETMARNGLIMETGTGYMALQFVVGIWEYQVENLDPELVADMEEYIPTLFNAEDWRKAPQMRTIPVNRSIDHKLEVLPHEKAEALIRDKKHFVIGPCICRKERTIAGKGCDKPLEACISFGDDESYFVKNNIGRRASRKEVLDLLALADRKGLVLQPSNAKNITWICCCCGCCCGVLRTLKFYPDPASLTANPFAVVLDASGCNGCGICLTRCQMEAFSFSGEKVMLDEKRCIGCGLCVSTCPTDALKLVRLPGYLQPRVPRNLATAVLRLAWKRKKIGPLRFGKMFLKSQRDRMLAGLNRNS